MTKRPCSANEVIQIARKACVGTGLPVDRAEDLADATVLLQCCGHDGLAALLDLLCRHDTDPEPDAMTAQIDLITTDEATCSARLTLTRLRPHIEGVAMIDWLIANPGDGVAEIKALHDAVMLAGLLVCAVRRYGGAFLLHTRSEAASVVIADLSVLGAGLPVDTPWHLSYRAGRPVPAPLAYHHTDTACTVWAALAARAHLTYVPASEASRQTGAGAGLVDND